MSNFTKKENFSSSTHLFSTYFTNLNLFQKNRFRYREDIDLIVFKYRIIITDSILM